MNSKAILPSINKLRESLQGVDSELWSHIQRRAVNENPWFTPESLDSAQQGLITMLSEQSVESFLNKYESNPSLDDKVVGVICAGNIPGVGFLDALCVLLSGADLQIKLSSSDTAYMTYLLDELAKCNAVWETKINKVEQLKIDALDAVIATGSDNTSRYFEKYFESLPNIIRKNRSSLAVLTGEESEQEMQDLGKDVFSYFGMGCRNVSKLLLPKGFDVVKLLDNWEGYAEVMHHHKYKNNYDYYKSIFLVNKEPHLDTGYVLLKESEELVSPLSVVYYQYYDKLEEVENYIRTHENKIQCICEKDASYGPKLGESQSPGLEDYPDGVDVMEFLFKAVS